MTFASPFVTSLPYFADAVVERGLPQLRPMAVNSNEHPPVVFASLVLLKGQGSTSEFESVSSSLYHSN